MTADSTARDIFSHPQYGDTNYISARDCSWTIVSAGNNGVQLDFIEFEVSMIYFGKPIQKNSTGLLSSMFFDLRGEYGTPYQFGPLKCFPFINRPDQPEIRIIRTTCLGPFRSGYPPPFLLGDN